MPSDSAQLRDVLLACMPSVVIDGVAKESGQRVVYYAHFDDSLIPDEILQDETSHYLKGWSSWGRVVVKVVAGASLQALTRLQAEASLLTELKSSQFPVLFYANYFAENPLTDEALGEGLYVSVEEFVESVPLSAMMGKYVGAPSEVFRLAGSILCGLRPLWEHKRKLVHRDIKPDNLLITDSGKVVIIDFGIVRETGSQGVTKEGFGNAPGSWGYAAPEHIANDKDLVSFKTDFFSLGVVMYQLIAGHHPFIVRPNMDVMEIVDATERYFPPSLEELGLATPVQSNLVRQMMEKKPYLRPRSIDILAAEFKKLEESV